MEGSQGPEAGNLSWTRWAWVTPGRMEEGHPAACVMAWRQEPGGTRTPPTPVGQAVCWGTDGICEAGGRGSGQGRRGGGDPVGEEPGADVSTRPRLEGPRRGEGRVRAERGGWGGGWGAAHGECGFQATAPNSPPPSVPLSWSGTLNEPSSCRYLMCLLRREKLECPKWRKSDVTYGWAESVQSKRREWSLKEPNPFVG